MTSLLLNFMALAFEVALISNVRVENLNILNGSLFRLFFGEGIVKKVVLKNMLKFVNVLED